ncbi:MAG TPA: heme-binding domain-containing protein [Candidatus Acidoferrum sp.]|nr:heme-binding domain-containing protein [Candidatus Acidoferrum sp.]
MKTQWKWVLAGAAAVFALAQVANPSRSNPAVVPGRDLLTAVSAPPGVAASLRAACYDCHSYETRWPWYSHVAPASWLVAADVRDGRERLNFSDWPVAQPERAAKRLGRISEEVGYRNMPPGKYTLLHQDARLTDTQRQALMDWADAEAARLKAAVTNQ